MAGSTAQNRSHAVVPKTGREGFKGSVFHPFRPALRGGVTGGEPPLYPAEKSNGWIALKFPPAMPCRAGRKGPLPGAETPGPHKRPTKGPTLRFTPWLGRGLCPARRRAANALKAGHRGTRFEGRSAGAERPSALRLSASPAVRGQRNSPRWPGARHGCHPAHC